MNRLGRELFRFFRGFRAAARGIALCLRQERNFRFHLCAACYVAAFGALAGFSRERLALLFLCFGLMLGAEAVNTAIERLCDRTTRRREESIRNIKDMAAGAVLCCAVCCAGVGLALFGDRAVWQAVGAGLAARPGLGVLLAAGIPAAAGFIFLTGGKNDEH